MFHLSDSTSIDVDDRTTFEYQISIEQTLYKLGRGEKCLAQERAG
jgi:hypothetical protein